jgi:hypothetical protein
MKVQITLISMLIIGGTLQAGLLQTIAEMPGKAVEATGTVVRDVVTAPENIVKDTVTAPARIVGAIPTKEEKAEEKIEPAKGHVQPVEEPAALEQMPQAIDEQENIEPTKELAE